MCGIAGIWNGDKLQGTAASRVSAMLERMSHRGPDGRGGFVYDGGAAGMVRLALVDLSDRGQQPLWSTDRRVAILFNGEIYNFREHRKSLSEKGYRFLSTTDSEVILALYLEYGQDFVHHLRGMYAIALFDWRHTRVGGLPELLLARDPLGIKPLYVVDSATSGCGCLFASEIRSLIASRLFEPRINQKSLRDFLRYGFTIQPLTILSGVRMLEPGVLEHYVPGKPVVSRRFWTMPAYEPVDESLDEAADRLRNALDQSISLHAFADAKVGAFLSGGVDSTGVVGLMRNHIPRLKTYTLRYPEFPGYDESAEAQASASRFDCDNSVVDVTGQEVHDCLPTFAGDLDQPSTDGLNTWMISRAAGREVKGVLSGLGGDEWFAGYPCARRMLFHASTTRGRALMQLGKWAGRIDAILPNRGFNNRLRERIENLATRRSLIATWVQTHTTFTSKQVRSLTNDYATEDPLEPFVDLLQRGGSSGTQETPIGLCGQLDVAGYMRCQLLRDSDATSMAHSLELRVPFVDIELARYSRSCKDEYKLDLKDSSRRRDGTAGAKRVLLHALRDVLPPEMNQRPKRGFVMPIWNWMNGELKDIVKDTCSSASVERRGLLDKDAVAAMVAASGDDASWLFPRTWALVVLELWCRTALDETDMGTELGTACGSVDLVPLDQQPRSNPLVDTVGCG